MKRAVARSPIPILADQVRLHPHYTHRKLRRYARETDTMVTAYGPLAQGGLVDEGVLAEIGDRYDKTPAQGTLRWATRFPQVAAISKSTSRDLRRRGFDEETIDRMGRVEIERRARGIDPEPVARAVEEET